MKGFNSLDLYYKSDILKQQADYLLTIQTDEHAVKLYAWDRFFIEQHFDRKREVTKINIAQNADMHKYLMNISLRNLGYLPVL